MLARTAVWWTILRISLEERLVYRGDFALGTLMRFLPILTQILLWWAVFTAASSGQVVTQTRNVADTRLEVTGPVATQWMSIAQCFAGMPVDPPEPGTRGPQS